MFEVAKVFLIQVCDFLPELIGLYVIFDFLGGLLPTNGSRWR